MMTTEHTIHDHHLRKRGRKRPLELALLIAALLSATISSTVIHVHALVSPYSSSHYYSTTHALLQSRPTITAATRLRSAISSEISRGGAAAAGWLFTPDRTASVIADTVADVALEAAAYAADTAATITTETVVQTIYKAPFLSLAISFILGGLLFSTVAAFVAATYSFGKENTRRLREVLGILIRRNWMVIRMQWMFTLVSVFCCCEINYISS
jgi:hypothetical protein